MRLLEQAGRLLRLTRSHDSARRYIVVNGFDGALAMLGLIIGFLVSMPAELSVIINVCLGAAIALGMSGVSSAYISEVAERRYALGKLEAAMVTDLKNSTHGEAARRVPLLIALVNGAAPLVISLIILIPLWLASAGIALPLSPLYASIAVAGVMVFMLGAFLGRIADISWLQSGIHTLLVAIITAGLIYLFTGP